MFELPLEFMATFMKKGLKAKGKKRNGRQDVPRWALGP